MNETILNENLRARQEIGGQLRAARERAGLTIRELAERAGLDKMQITRAETGTTNVGIDTLAAIGRALGFEVTIKPL